MPETLTPNTSCNKLRQLKSGALFMHNTKQRISRCFEIISPLLAEIENLIWITQQNRITNTTYKNLILDNSEGYRSKIYFFPIESISYSDTNYLKLHQLATNRQSICILDDSALIKNLKSGRTKRLLQLSPLFKYRLILSAAPICVGLLDLYTQLEFMNPKLLKMNRAQFSNIYLQPMTGKFDNLKKWSTRQLELKLLEKITPYVLDNDLEINIPVKRYNFYFNLTEKEATEYEREKNALLAKRDYVHFMELFHKFQHIYTLCESKVKMLFELICQFKFKQEKVIIYVKYIDEIRFFQESGWFSPTTYTVLTGFSNQKKALYDFTHHINIMFSTYGVDNSALTVPCCNNVIFFSQTFDYKFKLQAIKNLSNQKDGKQINIYDFWVNTGLDDMIRQNLRMKHFVIENVSQNLSQEEALRL